MEWLNWVEQVLRKYAQFDGRSRRKEYWYFMLFYYCVVLAFSLLSVVVLGLILLNIFVLAMFIPCLAVTVRRLHDIGRSGVWMLIGLVPVLGWVLLVIWLCQESEPGDNRYGPNPLGQKAAYRSHAQKPVVSQGTLAIKCVSGTLRGHTYRIGSEGIVLGRAPNCAVRYGEGVPGISNQHCCVRQERGVPVLIDLNSRYGTWLENGKKLPPNYPEYLSVGSKFYLGSPSNMCQIIYM